MKDCKVCSQPFKQYNSIQNMCVSCAIKKGRERNVKAQKKKDRVRKKELKTRGDYVREAQRAVNAFVRIRDHDEPCISCSNHSNSTTGIGGRYDAGHYRSVGSCPELRFNTWNIRKQCKRCNDYLGGNPIEYRIRLIVLIGKDRIEWLEGHHELKKYSIDDLERIKRIFNKRTRLYKRLKNVQ